MSVGTPPGAVTGESRPILPLGSAFDHEPADPSSPQVPHLQVMLPTLSGTWGQRLIARLTLAGSPALLPVLRRNYWCHMRPEGETRGSVICLWG